MDTTNDYLELSPTVVYRSKNIRYSRKLHKYMLNNNMELLQYLFFKGEYDDFLIYRSDMATKEYVDSVEANFPFPEECANEILFLGVENSFSEYLESLCCEIEGFNFDDVNLKNDIIKLSLPVVYSFISCKYNQIQEQLDKELLEVIQKAQRKNSIETGTPVQYEIFEELVL